MTFTNIPHGTGVFLDANSLIYHFTNESRFGPACTDLLKRVEQQDVRGVVSTDVAHRLMTLEAIQSFSWPVAGIAARLRRHHAEISRLQAYQHAIARIPLLRIQVIAVDQPLVESASRLSQQYELLTGDALIVAAMQANGLNSLASNDADFDRVRGIVRYSPI